MVSYILSADPIIYDPVTPSGLDHLWVVTRGSQGLALGLTLIAAPQLGVGSNQ